MRKTVLVGVTFGVLAGSISLSSASPSLAGRWRGTYSKACGGVAVVETVQITQKGTWFHAVKTVGNACVPKGAITFFGSTDAGEPRCFQALGTPGDPVHDVQACVPLRWLDDTHIRVAGVTFERVK